MIENITAEKLLAHDLSAGEIAYGHLLYDGSRWVKIGETYGYPGPHIYTIHAGHTTVTHRDENFHTVGVDTYPGAWRGFLHVTMRGPGRWDRGEFDTSTADFLDHYEPFKARSER